MSRFFCNLFGNAALLLVLAEIWHDGEYDSNFGWTAVLFGVISFLYLLQYKHEQDGKS